MIYHDADLKPEDIGIDDNRLRFLATDNNVYEFSEFKDGQLTDTQRLHICDCLMERRELHGKDVWVIPAERGECREIVQLVETGELWEIENA